ncbi:MAG: hypothetical protein QME60_03130 [Verrucomicrobiota bacterium]|nr:hypothetical protein [Verrucomicrobiota bacterium]
MEKDSKKAGQTAKKPAQAVLFELEMLSVGGRKIVFDTLKRLLADKDIELAPALFARYCLNGKLKDGIARLIKEQSQRRFSEVKFAEEFMTEMETAFSQPSLKADPSVNAMIRRAREAGAQVGALGCLSQPTIEKLTRILGWECRNIRLMSRAGTDKVFPTADMWLKLAKSMVVRPNRCVVVTTSQIACKSALAAGMKSVAVPDEYTAFQDFGGADFVVESLSKNLSDKIFELLHLV